MKLTCTMVDDRGDDRLYRVDAEPPQAPRFFLVSRYGSRMYGNQHTCIWPALDGTESGRSTLATYRGDVTHDEAMARFGFEVKTCPLVLSGEVG